jgi:RHS repeat-associated protein
MNFMRRTLLIAILFLGITAPLIAQVTTGLPPFGSFAGVSVEQVNLANLNVHLTLPIESKPGRGLSFVYNISYDGSIWTPVGSSGSQLWTPAPNFGFRMGLPAWNGSLTYSYSSGCNSYPYVGQVCWSSAEDYAYTDGSDTLHAFSYGSYCVNGQCTPYGSTVATDGSGYTLCTSSCSVITPSGTMIYIGLSSLGNQGAMEDSNGNYISATTTAPGANITITDTVDQSALYLDSNTGPPPFAYYDTPSGNTYIGYTQYTVRTAFGCSGVSEYGPTTQYLPTEITLPDGTGYGVSYEQTPGYGSGYTTGRIASIRTRNGGTIYYTYTGSNDGISCSDGSTASLNRQTPDGTWQYARSESGTAWTTTITDPQSDKTVMNFQGIYPTETQVYNPSSTLLKTTYACYNGSASPCNSTSITLPITQTTTYTQWPGGLESKTNTTYNAYGLITEKDEYAYGSGSPGSIARKTVTAYASLGNGIVNRPSTVTVEDGSNNIKAQTTYCYDEATPSGTTTCSATGSPAASSGTLQHVAVTGSRGNTTTIAQLVSGSATLGTTFTYYDTGMANVTTDVNGAQTTYNYANATSTCENAFPTSVTEPLSLTKSAAWDCGDGSPTSLTDENGATTSFGYSGTGSQYCVYYPGGCMGGITDPLGNVTQLTYTGQTSVESSMVFNSNNSTSDTLTTVDGLGRPHLSQVKESPSSTTYDSIETDYDSVGRPNRTTVPYAGTAGQTNASAPSVSTTYDALWRPLSVADAGGRNVTYAYSQNDILVTAGPAPTGENTKRKQLEYDALGRLTSVCEITSASGGGACGQNSPQTGYWTTYTYDVNNNLTNVTQNAQSSSPQTRTYVYDDLSRLTSETNPESAATTYTYDTDTTCGTSKGDPVKKIDAAGDTICYAYDALHRMISTTYSGTYASVTPSRHYVYDSKTVDGVAMVDAKTRLAEAYTCFSPCSTNLTDEGFSYTARGEVSDIFESTPHSGPYYHVNSTYWANGASSQLNGINGTLPVLPGLPTTTYGVDGEGRIYSASASSGQNPLSSTTYNVASLPTAVNLGSSDSDSLTYDPNTDRLTKYTFSVNSQSVVGSLDWNPLGTLLSLAITDPFNSSDAQTCSYSHDDLARIASDNCGSVWSQTFTYDPFGNINKSGSSSFGATYSTSTNHMTMIGSSVPAYDTNGNVTNDFLNTYSWDANGRPVTADSVGLSYDALGRMVEQNRGGSYIEIVYAPSGAKLALMNGSSLQKGFVPLTGGSMAVYSSSGLDHYRHSDWLGSNRLCSSPSRTVTCDVAYGPYGETYAPSGSTDPSFTGQNQDTAANLYDFPAREYGIQGRWPSPDPAGIGSVDPTDPQTWNRYAYVRNSPLVITDPSGEDSCGLPVPGIGANCEDGGEANEIPNLDDIMNGTWFDTVFGPQNQSYGGAVWDNFVLQTTFGPQYYNLPGYDDPVKEALQQYNDEVAAAIYDVKFQQWVDNILWGKPPDGPEPKAPTPKPDGDPGWQSLVNAEANFSLGLGFTDLYAPAYSLDGFSLTPNPMTAILAARLKQGKALAAYLKSMIKP